MARLNWRRAPTETGAARRRVRYPGLRPRAMLAVAFISLGSSTYAAQPVGPQRSAPPAPNALALAERYEDGESVRRDYHLALALYCQAARSGDPEAFLHIGWMYLNGRGVPRSDATAVMWLRKAAARGISQAANLLDLLPDVPAARAGGCPGEGARVALNRAPPAIRALADETSRDLGLSSNLLLSVMAVESGFDPKAVSPKSAAGLMQLMPETAARFGVEDRFDPRANVRGGATYLRFLLEMFGGNLTLALAAYNAGEKAVLSYGGVPPYHETTSYVAAVKRLCACGE